jgi:hypothetical protein
MITLGKRYELQNQITIDRARLAAENGFPWICHYAKHFFKRWSIQKSPSTLDHMISQ